MDIYQPGCKHDIAETCCASISMDQLKNLCDDKARNVIELPGRLDYGTIRGSEKLRSNLAKLYSSKATKSVTAENILITPGAIAANYLVYYSLLEPGDHVICHHPTYQQLYSVPESLGAEVDLWEARSENDWIPDIEELKMLIKPNTKIITIKYDLVSPASTTKINEKVVIQIIQRVLC
jgi:aspartate/methionine/tyrosine aminotransferase